MSCCAAHSILVAFVINFMKFLSRLSLRPVVSSVPLREDRHMIQRDHFEEYSCEEKGMIQKSERQVRVREAEESRNLSLGSESSRSWNSGA